MRTESLGEYDVIESDVLIIGGGLAGANAAMAAAKQGCRVVLIDKGFFGKTGVSSGNSYGTTTAVIREPDTQDTLVQDMLEVGRYINKRKIVELFAEGVANGVILELERLGVIFKRDGNNNIVIWKHGAHSYPRCTHFTWQNVPNMMKLSMIPELLNLGIRIFNKTLVTKLLLKDGEIAGAYAIDIISGIGKVFRAKSTVLAAGNAALLFGLRAGMMTTGDGYSLAYQGGALLRDMEFVSCSLGLADTRQLPGLLGEPPCLQSSKGELPKMYNANDERFMERYDPQWLEGCAKYKYMYAICNEVREGRGTEHGGVWIETVGLDKNAPFYEFFVNQLSPLGIDVHEARRLEYAIAPYYFTGGVEYDTSHESSLPGLFVAGEVSAGLHGAERMPATSVPECVIFGQRAGRYAAQRAMKTTTAVGINLDQVKEEDGRLKDLLNMKGSVSSNEYRAKIQDIMWNRVGFIRDGSRLSQAAQELAGLRKELQNLKVRSSNPRYNSDWIEVIEDHFLIDVAEMVAKASLMRRETRGAHCRDDFPEEDNNWRKNIVIKKNGEEMVLSTSRA